ncbi:MAG: ABC transporter ATP-binding protein, partial [Actinobacteria bacterium]|nr:ABC transporter ATP-binding protein [Actinomycetota bacterium]
MPRQLATRQRPLGPVLAATPVIELSGVGKTYRGGSLQVEALRDVSLRI